MRAFIEHRGSYGFLGLGPKFTLYLQIEFSNEERAIVLTRALQHYIFDLKPGYLASTESRLSPNAIAAAEIGGLGLFCGGIVGCLAVAFLSALAPVAVLAIFGGVAMFWHAQWVRRREKRAYAKEITVGYLVNHPSIAVQTFDPAQAAVLEENLRSRLTKLKQFLTQTHELSTRRAFEL